MKTGKIEIKTLLHSGIYKSQGGGETVTLSKKYNIGPLNLIRAMRELDNEIESNRRRHGEIGMGESWITINGIDIRSDLLPTGSIRDCKEFLSTDYSEIVAEDERIMSEMWAERVSQCPACGWNPENGHNYDCEIEAKGWA